MTKRVLIIKVKSVVTEFSGRYFLTNAWTERAGRNAAMVCGLSRLFSVILILTHLPGNTNSLIVPVASLRLPSFLLPHLSCLVKAPLCLTNPL